jgi:hypothetical protein
MATSSLPIQRLEQQAAVRISSSHFVPRPTRSTPYLTDATAPKLRRVGLASM